MPYYHPHAEPAYRFVCHSSFISVHSHSWAEKEEGRELKRRRILNLNRPLRIEHWWQHGRGEQPLSSSSLWACHTTSRPPPQGGVPPSAGRGGKPGRRARGGRIGVGRRETDGKGAESTRWDPRRLARTTVATSRNNSICCKRYPLRAWWHTLPTLLLYLLSPSNLRDGHLQANDYHEHIPYLCTLRHARRGGTRGGAIARAMAY